MAGVDASDFVGRSFAELESAGEPSAVSSPERAIAIVLSAASAGAMFYIGLYQSRVVERMWCPLNGRGCELVADAPFAHPFGVPDGYLGALLYLTILGLLFGPSGGRVVWTALVVLSVLAVVANVIGVYDMTRGGAFCTYCLLTTVASPLLVWAVWRLK
jgi:uncharacterized membrane protein